jgi:hypothetical protein
MKNKSVLKKQILVYGILCAILLLIVVFSMLGEKVAYNDGAGWDGLFYRNVAYNFSNMIFDHQYDLYHIKRIFPFAVINIVFNVFNIEKNNISLLWGIQTLNFVALFAGVYFFAKISGKLNFSIPLIIVSFSALFFNYPILKLMGYYPFLTDTYALVFAIIQFYCFINRKKILLIVVSIFGAFTWPTIFLCGLILEFLPREELALGYPGTRVDRVLFILLKTFFIFAIPITFVLGGMAFFYLKGRNILEIEWTGIVLNKYFVIPALFAVPLYIWALLRPVKISIADSGKRFFLSLKYSNIILFIIIYFFINATQRYFSSTEDSLTLIYMLFARLLMPSVQAPLAFVVCNFMYYGFVIILLCIFWEDAFKRYANYGYSFFIIIVLGLMMSVNTESRHMLSFMPFLLFPLFEVIGNYVTVKFSIVFSLLSLLLSRFWFKINVEGIEEAFIFVSHDSYARFPAQRYFMSQGPWMSYPMYLIFSGIFLVSFIMLYLYIKKIRKKEVVDE